MGDIPTVMVKNPKGDGYMIINKSDFDDPANKGKFTAVKGGEDVQNPAAAGVEVTDQGVKNPSGTYSTPTPSDIRYPNKDDTEFENNHGAFVGKSAAQMRKARGLPDKPGGLNPNADVDIPDDWKDKKPAERKDLANQLAGDEEERTSAEANQAIQDELDRREAAEKAGEGADVEQAEEGSQRRRGMQATGRKRASRQKK